MPEAAETPPAEEPQSPEEEPVEPSEPSPEEQEGDEQGEQGDSPEEPAEGESPQQPEGKSQAEIEKGLESLDREAKRHAKRVGEIMEEDAQALLACELCEPVIPGFRWPQVPEERRAAVMLAIGFDPKPDLLSDKRSSACPDCKGEGLVATGSKVKGQDALACTDCNGRGWVGPRAQAVTPTYAPAAAAEPINGDTTTNLTPEDMAAIEQLKAKGVIPILPTGPTGA